MINLTCLETEVTSCVKSQSRPNNLPDFLKIFNIKEEFFDGQKRSAAGALTISQPASQMAERTLLRFCRVSNEHPSLHASTRLQTSGDVPFNSRGQSEVNTHPRNVSSSLSIKSYLIFLSRKKKLRKINISIACCSLYSAPLN